MEQAAQELVGVVFLRLGAGLGLDAAHQVLLGGGVGDVKSIAVLQAAPGHQVVSAGSQAGDIQDVAVQGKGAAGFHRLGHKLAAGFEDVQGNGLNLVAEGIGILEVEVKLETDGYLAVAGAVIDGLVAGGGEHPHQGCRHQGYDVLCFHIFLLEAGIGGLTWQPEGGSVSSGR